MIAALLRWQWEGYARYHRSRNKLSGGWARALHEGPVP